PLPLRTRVKKTTSTRRLSPQTTPLLNELVTVQPGFDECCRNPETLAEIDQQPFDAQWVACLSQPGKTFTDITQSNAERHGTPDELALQKCTSYQESSHEFVGPEFSPVNAGTSPLDSFQVSFVRRHHGERRLRRLSHHRRSIEYGVTKLVCDGRALEIVPI